MANVLFTNVRILDGSGAPAHGGEVMVQGNRIARLAVMKDGRYHEEPELAGQGARRLSVA